MKTLVKTLGTVVMLTLLLGWLWWFITVPLPVLTWVFTPGGGR